MEKFDSIEDLVEAKAQKSHQNNLNYGGVFNADGSPYSDIELERKLANDKIIFVSKQYAPTTIGVNIMSKAAYYIRNFGYAEI